MKGREGKADKREMEKIREMGRGNKTESEDGKKQVVIR